MRGLIEGRIVHIVLDNSEHRAAIITKVVHNPKETDVPYAPAVVNLNVQTAGPEDAPWLFDPEMEQYIKENPNAMPEVVRLKDVPYDQLKACGTWHWTEQS